MAIVLATVQKIASNICSSPKEIFLKINLFEAVHSLGTFLKINHLEATAKSLGAFFTMVFSPCTANTLTFKGSLFETRR